MRFTKKAVAALLSGVALSLAAGQASAISVATTTETFPATGIITDVTGTIATAIGTSLNNGGGIDNLGRAIATGHIMTVGAGQAGVYHDYTTVKSWADLAIDLGWMHNADWVQVNVTTAGNYNIKSEVIGYRNAAAYTTTSTNATTGAVTTNNYAAIQPNGAIHPAFSIWSLSGNTFTTTGSTQNTLNSFNYTNAAGAAAVANYGAATASTATHYTGVASAYADAQYNSDMGFNQVASPTATNNSAFLLAGGVNDIVGYSNSGVSFVNGNGDAVGSGSAGASNGTTANGFLYTDLTTYLEAGSYLIAVGGSCVDLVNCGPTQALTKVVTQLDGTSVTTQSSGYTTGWHELTVTSVPVPGAVWLFGSAMAGLIGFGRRKQAVAA